MRTTLGNNDRVFLGVLLLTKSLLWSQKESFNLKFSCSGDEEKGRKKSQADDRPGVHHAFREGEVCVNVKNTFEDCQVGFFLNNGN